MISSKCSDNGRRISLMLVNHHIPENITELYFSIRSNMILETEQNKS